MKQAQPKFILVITAIFIASFMRVLPHWPNFTPMAAMALMGGAFLADKRMAFLIPLISLFISDILTIVFLNNHWISTSDFFGSPSTWLLYASYVIMTFFGISLKNNYSAIKLTGAATVCSLLFFITSNFGVWLINDLPKNASGLADTYILGIPFLGYDLAGNIFYSFLFFGLFRLVCNRWPSLSRASIN